MARVSVSNEFFRQKARRESMSEAKAGSSEESELERLKAKVEQMEMTIQESNKRNALLVQEMDVLKEQIQSKPETSILSRLAEVEEAFLQKCEETATAINELRKEASLPSGDKLGQQLSQPNKAASSSSLGIPWGALKARPWSSESESTALSIKESSLPKRLAPELGTKFTIYEDSPKPESDQKHDYSFEMLDDKLTSPLGKNSSPAPSANLENTPDLNAPHTRTRSKSPPKTVKSEPVKRPRRRRRMALTNITSNNNKEESDDDNSIFDFVEQDDLIEQTARRSKRRRAA